MVYNTLNEAYQKVLRDVLECPQFICGPRGMLIKEILGYKFTVNEPTNGEPIVTADEERNQIIAAYTNAEFDLYASQTRDVEEYARASAFWKTLANPDGTINSAYGHLIWGRKVCGNLDFEHKVTGFEAKLRTPWEWAMQALVSDKDTRQAILHFDTPEVLYLGNKDVVCTMFAQFFIRQDKLHLIVSMRSNDVIVGLVYDMVWFASLLHRAQAELASVYPKLKIGSYAHIANSMHVYKRHWESAKKMLFEPNDFGEDD